jgi:hypothetical protein
MCCIVLEPKPHFILLKARHVTQLLPLIFFTCAEEDTTKIAEHMVTLFSYGILQVICIYT